MGRVAESWRLRPDKRSGILRVVFRHDGFRFDRSTGERDRAKARPKAVRIYAAIVSGKAEKRVVGKGGDRPLGDLILHFLADLEGQVSKKTAYCYARTALTHIEPHFKTIAGFTSANVASFCRARIRGRLRVTVQSDLKVMRRFVGWAIEKGIIVNPPAMPSLPTSLAGERKVTGRKSKAVHLTDAEARAIIAQLPERSERKGFLIRSRYALQWETSLRQATIARLRVPEHYKRGSATLTITDPIDKAQFGRELPLTDVARAILDEVCPESGPIFGERNDASFRPYVKAAAAASGLAPEKALAFSAYDLRHGRITDLLDAGAPLTAVAFLAGHLQLTTTNRYVQVAAATRAATRALRDSGGISGVASSVSAETPEKTTD